MITLLPTLRETVPSAAFMVAMAKRARPHGRASVVHMAGCVRFQVVLASRPSY